MAEPVALERQFRSGCLIELRKEWYKQGHFLLACCDHDKTARGIRQIA